MSIMLHFPRIMPLMIYDENWWPEINTMMRWRAGDRRGRGRPKTSQCWKLIIILKCLNFSWLWPFRSLSSKIKRPIRNVKKICVWERKRTSPIWKRRKTMECSVLCERSKARSRVLNIVVVQQPVLPGHHFRSSNPIVVKVLKRDIGRVDFWGILRVFSILRITNLCSYGCSFPIKLSVEFCLVTMDKAHFPPLAVQTIVQVKWHNVVLVKLVDYGSSRFGIIYIWMRIHVDSAAWQRFAFLFQNISLRFKYFKRFCFLGLRASSDIQVYV